MLYVQQCERNPVLTGPEGCKNNIKGERQMSEIIKEEKLEEAAGGSARGPEWTQGGMTFYRSASGDTLSEIAYRFHTTPEAIQALNPTLIWDINRIFAGWEIRVL